MIRGPHGCDPSPIAAEEVAGWFAKCRGKKPSIETCAELALTLDGPPSAQWPAYSREQASALIQVPANFDYWNFAEVAAGLNAVITALPAVRKHWNNVTDCDDALSARSALAALETALATSRDYIEFPFGAYQKNYRKSERKAWHISAIIILRLVRGAFSTVKSGPIAFSANSQALKVTKLALERMGYGKIERATIAAHCKRWHDRYGDTMTTINGVSDLLPVRDKADR